SVEPTEYLDATLARAVSGAKLAALAEPLVGDDVTIDDARAYVGELVDAQLPAAGLDGPRAVLADVREAIAAIDGAGVGNSSERYLEVARRLEALPAK